MVQSQIITKKLKLYVINAYEVAKETGMGVRINTIMQTCFFAISGVLPKDEAIAKIKEAIQKTYGKRGENVVRMNFAAVDASVGNLFEVQVPDKVTSSIDMPPVVPKAAPEFVQTVTAKMIAGEGDDLPVSVLPLDGTYPTATTQWEKRNIALEIPAWDENICIQCGKCVFVCPHSVIRSKVYDESHLEGAPETFKAVDARWKELPGQKYTLQVAPEDCTGCQLCVEVCPVKDKRQVGRKAINMTAQIPIREQEIENWDFFLSLPEIPRTDGVNFTNVKNIQLLQPLFEFSGACAGCGETPYVSYSANCSGIEPSLPTLLAVPVFTAATYQPPHGRKMARVAVQPGAIPSLRIMPNLGWGCASPLKSKISMPENWSHV
jgi:pyruvate-ferredoxin/flavodoxin oxidoreductase